MREGREIVQEGRVLDEDNLFPLLFDVLCVRLEGHYLMLKEPR